MSHTFEIREDRKIILDGQDITESVIAWSYSFSQGNSNMSGGKSPFALVLQRAVFIKKEPFTDDSGVCTFNQVLYDVKVDLRIEYVKPKIIPASGPLHK